MYTTCEITNFHYASGALVYNEWPFSYATKKASLRRFGNLNGGRFALVGVFIDVQPFVVDGVFHAAERFE